MHQIIIHTHIYIYEQKRHIVSLDVLCVWLHHTLTAASLPQASETSHLFLFRVGGYLSARISYWWRKIQTKVCCSTSHRWTLAASPCVCDDPVFCPDLWQTCFCSGGGALPSPGSCFDWLSGFIHFKRPVSLSDDPCYSLTVKLFVFIVSTNVCLKNSDL